MATGRRQLTAQDQQTMGLEVNSARPRHGLQWRYIILLLCMLVNIISYTTRMNINMTIVAMVKDNLETGGGGANETVSDTCVAESGSAGTYAFEHPSLFLPKATPSQDFDWSESLQGTIIGANYYGYIITTATGGQLAELLGAKRLIALAMLLMSLCTLLTPVLAYAHAYLVVADRVIIGLAQGVITSAMYTLLPYWIPGSGLGLAFGLLEFSGSVGSVITMPISAYLCEFGFAGGWPSVFYVFGAAAVLILLPWFAFVYDTPEAHPRISPPELTYIKANVSVSDEKTSQPKGAVPWGRILLSRKVWAIAITRFCNNWGSLLLRSKLPAYLKTVLHMPITYNGYVNASIYVSMALAYLLWGYVSDFINQRQLIGKSTSRKLFESLGLTGCAVVLATIPLMGCNVIVIVVLLNLSMFAQGLLVGGENVVCVDVAPDQSGTVYGFTNAIGSLPGFLAPLFAGVLLDQAENNPMRQWNILFWIGSGVYLLGVVIFCVFVNSTPEPWGIRSQMDSEESPQTKAKNIDAEGQTN